MSATNKALVRATVADIAAAGNDASAAEKAVNAAIKAATSSAISQVSSHTLTDGAVNGIVSVGSTAIARECQNVAGLYGPRARAVVTRILAAVGGVGVLATRRGTHAHAVANQSLTVATIDVVDAVHNGLVTSLLGGPPEGADHDGTVHAVVT